MVIVGREFVWETMLKPRYYDQGVDSYWLDETDGEGRTCYLLRVACHLLLPELLRSGNHQVLRGEATATTVTTPRSAHRSHTRTSGSTIGSACTPTRWWRSRAGRNHPSCSHVEPGPAGSATEPCCGRATSTHHSNSSRRWSRRCLNLSRESFEGKIFPSSTKR